MPIYKAGDKVKIPQKMVKHSQTSHNRRPLLPQPSMGQGQEAVETQECIKSHKCKKGPPQEELMAFAEEGIHWQPKRPGTRGQFIKVTNDWE